MNDWTVKQLIEYLNTLTEEEKEYTVSLEGCDCDGACGGASVHSNYKTLLLERTKK